MRRNDNGFRDEFWMLIDLVGVVNGVGDEFQLVAGVWQEFSVEAGLVAGVALSGIDGYF